MIDWVSQGAIWRASGGSVAVLAGERVGVVEREPVDRLPTAAADDDGVGRAWRGRIDAEPRQELGMARR